MSDLNELFAELKDEISERFTPGSATFYEVEEAFYRLDAAMNYGEFARAEQDAVS